MSSQRDWPHDLSRLQEIARDEIMEEWRADVTRHDRDWPTVEWLVNNGYSHLRWIVEQKHDMTIPVFFAMIVGAGGDDTEWELPIDDPDTVNRTIEYLDRYERYREWRSATKQTQYYLLKRVFAEYQSHTGREDIVDVANQCTHKTDTFDTFVEIIYQIKQDAQSDLSAYQYLRAIQRFYESLARRYIVEYNPTQGVEDEIGFDLSAGESNPLSPQQIADLFEAAETVTEHMLIIGYVFWGVRRKELPSMHQSQVDWTEDHATISFADADRKNGAGTVTIIFGERYLREQFERLSRYDTWDGHLIPAENDKSKPMKPEKAGRKFKELAERADVIVDGEYVTPNNGRSTWNELHARAGAVQMEIVDEYKHLQGSDDTEAATGYHTEEFREELRQWLFRKKCRSIVPEEVFESESIFETDLAEQAPIDSDLWSEDQ